MNYELETSYGHLIYIYIFQTSIIKLSVKIFFLIHNQRVTTQNEKIKDNF